MGPLAGLKVVEFAGLGPAPMAAMLLADLGATVLRIDRTTEVELGRKRPARFTLLNRGRQDIALDLKEPASVRLALELVAASNVLIEGFRPGVMERLGLGPEACHALNPGLVYGRMTGFGQEGPLAQAAGHDLNYIALSGALDAIGRPGQPPTSPLNLVGDFGGGSLYLVMGILSALYESRTSGRGQVVDAAIVDGALSLMTMHFGDLASELWQSPREVGTSPYYECYECADGRYVSVAAVEHRFLLDLLSRIGISPDEMGKPRDRSAWPDAHRMLSQRFKTRTQAEWCELLEGSDACFAPVLELQEVARHRHMAARRALIEVEGTVMPAPAPRFSRSQPPDPPLPATTSREEALQFVQGWLSPGRNADLEVSGLLRQVRGTRNSESK